MDGRISIEQEYALQKAFKRLQCTSCFCSWYSWFGYYLSEVANVWASSAITSFHVYHTLSAIQYTFSEVVGHHFDYDMFDHLRLTSSLIALHHFPQLRFDRILPVWLNNIASTLSASAQSLTQNLAAFLSTLTFWKRSKSGRVGDKKIPPEILQQFIQDACPGKIGSLCVLCCEQIRSHDPLLFLTCSNFHWFHLSCGLDFVESHLSCPVCHELVPQLKRAVLEKSQPPALEADEIGQSTVTRADEIEPGRKIAPQNQPGKQKKKNRGKRKK